MERVADILGPTMRQLAHPHAALAWLEGRWPALVGEQLAAHTRPAGCSGGLLEVSVDGKDWQDQIEGLEKALRDRINAAWGRELVREVRLVRRTRGRKAVPRELDNEHTPFVRRGGRAKRPSLKGGDTIEGRGRR